MNTSPRIPATPPSVLAQIARLPELPMPEIKALWQKLFSADTPNCNRPFLERRIAYRLQEVEFRKVDPNLPERNQRRIEALLETGKVQKRDRDTRPTAGTVLTREYRDVEYCVVATTDGQYEFNGRMYPSLSMIAREITGTRWSGPLFFGLKGPAKPETPARKGARR
ncbi:MAG: DUF2924 domain-containing protein [Candidatus Accumulibacter sp.]|uniref:DUF2924 domain-containing protein n=1 Tax=Accumulibacter sp. TaxID=2053492 RepID=UPI002584106F|nr:DUF2924 domain-containing protein [Accumulibacter sp.]MCM8620566.1 DUF2924 domain-containing protein [Accumulibacter sp.]